MGPPTTKARNKTVSRPAIMLVCVVELRGQTWTWDEFHIYKGVEQSSLTGTEIENTIGDLYKVLKQRLALFLRGTLLFLFPHIPLTIGSINDLTITISSSVLSLKDSLSRQNLPRRSRNNIAVWASEKARAKRLLGVERWLSDALGCCGRGSSRLWIEVPRRN